jgi:hypothetical protein
VKKRAVAEPIVMRIPEGTVVSLKGLPFQLAEQAEVLGLESNMKLAGVGYVLPAQRCPRCGA